MAAGVRHIRRTPVLMHATAALAIAGLVLGFSESTFYAVLDAFDQPVEFVGPLVAVQGVGAIVGGLLATRLVRRFGEPRTLLVSMGCIDFGMSGVAVAQELWQVLIATAVVGAGLPPTFVAYTTVSKSSPLAT